jgi:RNA polymerase sigma-70 factor (ECF subfamily)
MDGMSAAPCAVVADAAILDFESFWASEYRSLVRIAYALSGSAGVAEDLVQEAMLRAFVHWDTVRHADNPSAWIRRVLMNLTYSRGRPLMSEARALARLRGERRSERSLSHDASSVVDTIRQLPRREAQVVALHYLDDMSVQSIADVLGCPENTVKTRLRRGRERLGDLLRAETEELS